LEDNPLKTKQSKAAIISEQPEEEDSTIPTSADERALRIMEDLYEIYDFTNSNYSEYSLNSDEFVDLCEREDYIPLGLESSSGEDSFTDRTSLFTSSEDL
jgi:hypothetical protein